MSDEEWYDKDMCDDTDDVDERVESDIIVYDSLGNVSRCPRRMVFLTPIVLVKPGGGLDRGVNHDVEAKRIFSFLQHWISCRAYDLLYKLMLDSEGRKYHTDRSEFACIADVCDDDSIIPELERTILVLESVRMLYIDGSCSGCMPEAVVTMVDNEIALLRNKVDAIANDEGDES